MRPHFKQHSINPTGLGGASGVLHHATQTQFPYQHTPYPHPKMGRGLGVSQTKPYVSHVVAPTRNTIKPNHSLRGTGVLPNKSQTMQPHQHAPSPFQGEGWDGGESYHQDINLHSYALGNAYPHPKMGRGCTRSTHRDSGFSLVELIVVITIISILAATVVIFVRNPTQSYFDTETRAALTDTADTALRRMERDIHNALPNSVRVTTNGADSFIEFIPVKAAGRYRAAVGTSSSDNPLDFSLAADTFDVLGNPVAVAAGDRLVIYNLGITGADAYEGTNIRALQTTGTLSTLSFSGATPFPLASPSSRFYTVSTASTYMCDMSNRVLRLFSGYAIPTSQPASLAALSGLTQSRELARNVSACSISYNAGISQRTAIVNISLALTDNNATVRLMHQLSVMNSP